MFKGKKLFAMAGESGSIALLRYFIDEFNLDKSLALLAMIDGALRCPENQSLETIEYYLPHGEYVKEIEDFRHHLGPQTFFVPLAAS